MRALFLACLAAALAAPAMAESWRRIDDEAEFREILVDRPLGWQRVWGVVIHSDGRITGRFEWGEARGTWEWADDRFCRTIAIGATRRPYECLEPELRDDGRRVRWRRAGGGYFPHYDLD